MWLNVRWLKGIGCDIGNLDKSEFLWFGKKNFSIIYDYISLNCNKMMIL